MVKLGAIGADFERLKRCLTEIVFLSFLYKLPEPS